MAVRKNPDWSVWLADVWHWARQPPGIYICIIVVLAIAAIYPNYRQYQPASLPPSYRPPVPVPAAPPNVYPPQAQAPPSAPSICPDGQIYDAQTNRCLVGRPGTQNNCIADSIFIDRLNACLSIESSTGLFTIFPNNFFRIAGKRPTHVELLSGYAVANALAAPRVPSPKVLSVGGGTRFVGPWEISTTSGARIRIFYE